MRVLRETKDLGQNKILTSATEGFSKSSMVSEIKQCRNSGKCKNERINMLTGKKEAIGAFSRVI